MSNMFGKFGAIRRSGLRLLDVEDLAILLRLKPPSARVVAARMVRKGVLVRLKRNVYQLAGLDVHDFEIANKLIAPSYVSFESALHYWGVISQIPEVVTSSARRSKRVAIGEREFQYSRVPQELFALGVKKERTFFIATPEKALLDLFYYGSFGKRSVAFDAFDVAKISGRVLRALSKRYPDKTRALIRGLILTSGKEMEVAVLERPLRQPPSGAF